MGHVTETKTVKKKVKILPCINCGGEKVKLVNCNYSSFNKCSATCENCGKEYIYDMCFTSTDADIVRAWNKDNDPELIRKKILTKIKAAEKELEDLNERTGEVKHPPSMHSLLKDHWLPMDQLPEYYSLDVMVTFNLFFQSPEEPFTVRATWWHLDKRLEYQWKDRNYDDMKPMGWIQVHSELKNFPEPQPKKKQTPAEYLKRVEDRGNVLISQYGFKKYAAYDYSHDNGGGFFYAETLANLTEEAWKEQLEVLEKFKTNG